MADDTDTDGGDAVTLDDLSDPQREALSWLAEQARNGNARVTPPDEHRSQTWRALVKRELVTRHDDGTVQVSAAGSALFAHQASEAADTVADGAQDAAEQAEAAARNAREAAEQVSEQANEAQRTGEQAAATADAAAAPPPAEDQPGRVALGELRPQHRGRDERGDWRVIGIPEPLHGSREGHVRVLVTRNERSRDYLRGPAEDTVELIDDDQGDDSAE